jgi:hypothetical protein
MMMTDPEMKKLDDLLGQAANVRPAVSDDLMARVLADAALLQPAPVGISVVARRQNRWENLLDIIGGWPALGGLATAGIVGVWMGAAPPEGLETFAADLIGTTQSVDLLGDSLGTEWSAAFDG